MSRTSGPGRGRGGALRAMGGVLAWACVACGGTTGAGDAATDTGALDAPPDAATDATTADVAVDAPPPVTANPMLLSSSVLDNGTSKTTNLLFANAIASPGQRCAVSHTAPCYVIDCRDAGDAGQVAGVPAGTLTASTATMPGVLSGNPDSNGLYAVSPLNAPQGAWSAGDHVTLAAQGGTIPAFDAGLTYPAALTLTSPSSAAGSTIAVDRTMALVVTWGTTTAASVVVGLQQSPPSGDPHNRDLRFVCEFPGASGTGTIPTSLLGRLEASGATAGSASMFVGAEASTDVTPGGYTVHAYVANAVAFGVNVF